MSITVLGAAGGTGSELVAHALAAGHQVVAGVRDPAKITRIDERLRLVACDVLDEGSLADAIPAGTEAVMFAVGTASGRAPTRLFSEGVANVLRVMDRAGVTRILTVSAYPVAPAEQVTALERYALFPILRLFFGGSYEDQARMEAVLADSAAKWTVLRPPRLLRGDPVGGTRRSLTGTMPRASSIRRSDLALEMLALMPLGEAVGKAVAVSR